MTSGAAVDRTLWWLIVASTALSVGHHIDHVLRDATGWPFPGHDVNPFTYSLAVYVILAVLVILTFRRVTGPGSWAVFTGVGVAFVASVHLGPAADDTGAMVRNRIRGRSARCHRGRAARSALARPRDDVRVRHRTLAREPHAPRTMTR